MSGGLNQTRRQGRPNTSGTATLRWSIASGDILPFEVMIRIVTPGQYGHAHIQAVTMTVEITSRLSEWMMDSGNCPQPPRPIGFRRLEVSERAALLDAILATLTSGPVVAAVADLADADPITVPPPRILHIVRGGQEIAQFLPPLPAIHGAGGSHGAHLQADPALSLAEPEDRSRQVTVALRDGRRRRAHRNGAPRNDRASAVAAADQRAGAASAVSPLTQLTVSDARELAHIFTCIREWLAADPGAGSLPHPSDRPPSLLG